MIEYPENVLIKCCNVNPKYHSIFTPGAATWLQCPCCNRRTVNTFKDNVELNLLWNEQMLRSGDPRRSLQGKGAILSLIDVHNKTVREVAEILGMEPNSATKYIKRIREEFEEIYEDSDDRQSS